MNKCITFLGIIIVGSAIFASAKVHAVPWCHHASIVTVATVNWDGPALLNQVGEMTAPPNVQNPDAYLAFHAGANYCEAYSGGGPSSHPDSGSVAFLPNGPYDYVHGGPYVLEDGLSFECDKCYGYPRIREAPPFRFPFE